MAGLLPTPSPVPGGYRGFKWSQAGGELDRVVQSEPTRFHPPPLGPGAQEGLVPAVFPPSGLGLLLAALPVASPWQTRVGLNIARKGLSPSGIAPVFPSVLQVLAPRHPRALPAPCVQHP